MSEAFGPHGLSNTERRKKDNKVWRIALWASLILHLLIFLWRGGEQFMSPDAAAGPRAGDDRAAGGAVQAMNVRIPTPQPIRRPQIPIPVPLDVEEIQIEEETAVDFSDILGNLTGPTQGPGKDDGDGEGDGGSGDEGRLALVAPSPRSVSIPFETNLKGKDAQIWVFVDEQGKVVADSTYIDPPTDDRELNELLIARAANWTFRPATRGGQAIAAWFPYRVSR